MVVVVSLDDSEKEMMQHFARDRGGYYRLGFAEAKRLTAGWGKLYKLHSIADLLALENAMPRELLVRDAWRIPIRGPDAICFTVGKLRAPADPGTSVEVCVWLPPLTTASPALR